jgi:hypothetical protein
MKISGCTFTAGRLFTMIDVYRGLSTLVYVYCGDSGQAGAGTATSMRSTLLVGGWIIRIVKFTSLGICAFNRGTEQGEAGLAPARASELRSGAMPRRLPANPGMGLMAARFPVAIVTAPGAAPFCESIELTIDCQPGTLPPEAGDCAQRVAAIASSRSKILIQEAPGSVYRAALEALPMKAFR